MYSKHKKTKALFTGVLFFFSVFLFSHSAHAAGVYDSLTGHVFDHYDNNAYGTTAFTASAGGTLTAVQLYLSAASTPTTATITLANGHTDATYDCHASYTQTSATNNTTGAFTHINTVSGFTGTQCTLGTGTNDYEFITTTAFSRGINETNHHSMIVYVDNSYIPDVSTHFTSFTVATSTEMATVQGYWNASTTASTTEYLDFYQTSATLGQEATVRTFATTTGAFSFTFPYLSTYFSTQSGTSTTIIGSNLTLHAKLWHYNGTDLAAYGFGMSTTGSAPILMDATSTTLTASSSVVFDTSSARSISNLPVACGLTDLGGCLQNMMTWLFYPTPDTIAQFSSIQLNGKFPFTYIYQIGQIRNDLLTSTTTVSTSLTVSLWKIGNAATSSIELISRNKVAAVPFSGTIYTVLTFLIWIMMAEYVYYRVIRIHDVTTPAP